MVLRGRKKKSLQHTGIKRVNPQEQSPTVLPEPQTQGRCLQSAPPSFRTRGEPVHLCKSTSSSRTRTLSAPSALLHAEDEVLASSGFDEPEEPKSRFGSTKEYNSPSPQPLPLPSSHCTNALKATSSFKMMSASGPLDTSEPLPMPRTLPPSLSTKGNLINFSFEEITSACNNFSPERYMSESLSSVIYRASFWEDPTGSRKLEASVTRLHPSNQVL